MTYASPTETELQECIEECTICHQRCLETLQYCLTQGGKHVALEHIRLLANCAELCQTSANFMLVGSEFQRRACALCAEVCEACQESCRSVDPDDEQMSLCAETCGRCAEVCRKMSGETSEAA